MTSFLFSILCYVSGIGSLIWFFWFLQFGLNIASPLLTPGAAVQDTIIFLLFPLQHSILARPGFKTALLKHLPREMERPLYTGTSGIAMILVLFLWRNGGPVWFRFPSDIPFQVVFYLALATIVWTTKIMGHAQLFGLKQGLAALRKQPLHEDSALKTTGSFGVIRHPLTSLLIVALWSHSTLTAGRFLFNMLFTAYSLVGTVFEERDLVKKFGQEYRDYRKKVPAFIPSPFRIFDKGKSQQR